MGKKATVIRDQYAEELSRYQETVPPSEWPTYRNELSRSGLAKIMRDRGFSRFDRKRLASAACRPIIKAMEARLQGWIRQADIEAKSGSETCTELGGNALDPKPVFKQTSQVVRDLERALAASREETRKFRSLCNRLEQELKQSDRQHSAFEKHCRKSLRTLHV